MRTDERPADDKRAYAENVLFSEGEDMQWQH